MTEPSPVVPPMPNSIKRSVAAVLLVAVVFAAVTTSLALAGERTLPAPLSAIVTISLATGVVALLARGFVLQILGHMDNLVGSVAARQDRRMDQIANGMIEHGIQLDAITGEIPRVRASATVCPYGQPATFHLPVEGAEVLPAPATVAAMRRLAHKITD